MGDQSPHVKFAVIGHLDSWEKIAGLVNLVRAEEGNAPLKADQIREMYSFFPPAKLFDVKVHSSSGDMVEGFYVETFIPPDELTNGFLWKNIRKVRLACGKAAALGADIVSLGGFTSIVLECGAQNVLQLNGTSFTTGNSLTAAFIVQAVESSMKELLRPAGEINLMIIGSTGDIGSACTRYFAGKVRKMLLCARQEPALIRQRDELNDAGVNCSASVHPGRLLPEADIVICAASSILSNEILSDLAPHAIVCDAGYPKNIPRNSGHRIIDAGMGVVTNGLSFSHEGYRKILYDLPVANTLHGCILESIVLAMEKKRVPFSSGRGNISNDQMREISAMARKNGIQPLIPLQQQQE